MAKFCENNCKARCEFCTYYKDDGEEIHEFAEEGICKILNIRVFCHEGYNCDDFECINLKKI